MDKPDTQKARKIGRLRENSIFSTRQTRLLENILTSLLGYVIITIIEQDESLVVDAAGIKDISVSVYEMNIVDAIGALSGSICVSGSIYLYLYI